MSSFPVICGTIKLLVEDLDAFIQASEDLKIIGMLDMCSNELASSLPQSSDSKRPRIEQTLDAPKVDDDIATIQAIINIEQEEAVTIELDQDNEDELEVLEEERSCEPEIIFCDKCEFETTSYQSFDHHIKNDHVTDVKCMECSFSASDKKFLKEHMLNNHKGIPCKSCQRRFSDISSLRKHVVTTNCKANILKWFFIISQWLHVLNVNILIAIN